MLSTREIRITDHLDTLWPLLEAHRDELATHKDLMALAPRLDVYRDMEAKGALLSVGLFDAGELVGYSVNIISSSLHYEALTICQNDVIFVAKPYRKGTHGVRLVQATEDAAKARGAQMILMHAKPHTSLDLLLPRMGYDVQDVIHSRVL